MKTLVLENEFKEYIPTDLKEVIDRFFSEDELEIWDRFSSSYRKDPDLVKKRFMNLCEGDNIVFQHVFVGFNQTELLTLIMDKLKSQGKRINVYLVNSLCNYEFARYLREYESTLVPRTKEYDDDPGLRSKFKKNMNRIFLEQLEFHNVYSLYNSKWMPTFNKAATKITKETVLTEYKKINNKDYIS